MNKSGAFEQYSPVTAALTCLLTRPVHLGIRGKVRACKQVFDGLDTRRDADEVVWEATGSTYGSGDGGMAHVAGEGYEGADTAKADRYLEQLRLLHNCATRLHAASHEVNYYTWNSPISPYELCQQGPPSIPKNKFCPCTCKGSAVAAGKTLSSGCVFVTDQVICSSECVPSTGGGLPAGLKAEQGATVGGLASVHIAPRVAGRAREVNSAHERVGGQVGGDPGAVGDLALHAQAHGLQAP